MKNVLLTISVATLLLAGQSAIAGSQDEVFIPVFNGGVSASVEQAITYQKISLENENSDNVEYDSTKDIFSIDYMSNN